MPEEIQGELTREEAQKRASEGARLGEQVARPVMGRDAKPGDARQAILNQQTDQAMQQEHSLSGFMDGLLHLFSRNPKK